MSQKENTITIGQILDKIEIAQQGEYTAKVNLSTDLKTIELSCDDTDVYLKGYKDPCMLGICTEVEIDYYKNYIKFGDVETREDNKNYYTCKGVYPLDLIEKIELSL